MKKIVLVMAGLTLTACSQNPASNLSAVASLAGTAGVPGLSAGQSVDAGTLVQKLNLTMANMNKAQEYTLAAFGKKKEAEEAASRAKFFETGNSVDAEVLQKTGDTNAEIDKLTESNKKLNAEGKKTLSLAMPYYSKSMLQSAGLGMQMEQAVGTISTNPTALLAGPYKAKDLITVFTASPKLLSQMATTTHHLVTYSSSNGVDAKEVNASFENVK